MFDRELFNKAPESKHQGSKYTGLVYGRDAECRRCNAFHPFKLTPAETDRADFMASKIAAKANLKEKGMVGILIDADGKIALAVSGNAKKANLTFQAARSIDGDLYQSLELAGDVDISKYVTLEEIGFCTAEGAAPPGNCAAPKLVAHALGKGWKLPFAISEVWSDRKNKAEDKFAKNEPIESCLACGKLVPLMMHGAG